MSWFSFEHFLVSTVYFEGLNSVFSRVQHCTVHVQYRDFALYGTVLYFQILDFEIDPVL